jgi:hypothetical protein
MLEFQIFNSFILLFVVSIEEQVCFVIKDVLWLGQLLFGGGRGGGEI